MRNYGASALKRAKNSRELIEVALGREKADLAVINAKLLNVYTGELLDNHAIGIKGEWIAYVGDDPKDIIGEKTTVVDVQGKTVIPGLIDGHGHLTWLFTVPEFLNKTMQGGTTTIVTETMEVFPVAGYDGLVDFMDSLHDQPVKIFGTAPAMVSISHKACGISRDNLKKILARDDIIGLGETYWQALFQYPDQMLANFDEALLARKTLEGHSAGARGGKLMAYISTGVSSCHEPINAAEAVERLRLGLYVMIREGAIRQDLEAISAIKDMNVDLRRVILVSDGVEPRGLQDNGYMEYVVQKAIDCGFDPVTAIQMSTINTAVYFSLDGLIGGLAPGRYADLLVIPDVKTIAPEYVISKGRIISQQGKLIVPARKHDFQPASLNTIRLPRKMKSSDFAVHLNETVSEVKVRVIEQITDLVTKELITSVPLENNKIKVDLKRDIVKVAAVDRTHIPGKTFVGLIKGFRLKAGALASSASWDASDIIVVGADEADMALAVNRIHEMQGGIVVCLDGEVKAELSMPVFGLSSELPFKELIEKREKLSKEAQKLGVPFNDPMLTLVTLTGAAIPYLRICEEGLVNLKEGQTLELVVK